MADEKQTLTHSRLSCFRACPRRHFYRHEIGLVPEVDDFSLRVGTAFHAALEAHDKQQDVDAAMRAAQLEPHDLALVAAMVATYRERWAGEELEVVASEAEFRRKVRNPETGAPSKLWEHAGKIDRIVKLRDGRLALQESKTSTEDLAPGSDYWLRLRLDQQISLYVIAAREAGWNVETILYDVTRRPLQRPSKATPEDKRKLKADGTPYANTRLVDETPEEFAARVAEVMRAEPDKFFMRVEIARLDDDLRESESELWQQQMAIRAAQRAGHWYRNPGACVTPRKCAYLSICHMGARELSNTVPSGFKRLLNVHPELSASSGQAEHATAGQAAESF